MLSEGLSGKIDSIRQKNTRLESRHREIELDKKYAMENGSAIMPSQIRVTITGKQNRGPHFDNGFDGYIQKPHQFNNYSGRRPINNVFSKSMSRLPQNASQCANFNQNQSRLPKNMHNGMYRGPVPPVNTRCPEKFQKLQESSQSRNTASLRYVEIDESFGRHQRNATHYGHTQSNFPCQCNELIITNRSQTRFNQRGNATRGGNQYGQQAFRGFPEKHLNTGRGGISNAKSMSSLDKLNPTREMKNGLHFEPGQCSYIPPHNENKNRSGRNTQPRFIHDQRKPRTSFCSYSYDNGGNNGVPSVPTNAKISCANSKNGSSFVSSDMSTQTNVWPLQPVPYNKRGLWVRGMVVREKDRTSEKPCESIKEASMSKDYSGECCLETSTQASSCSKATSPHRPSPQDDSNLSEDFVNFDDEYIDDNPLDDLDQFTLKIDMDGGFVVHDASIRDPILQKPICSWIEDELDDLNINEEVGVDEAVPNETCGISRRAGLKRSSSLPSNSLTSRFPYADVSKSSSGTNSSEKRISSMGWALRTVASAGCLIFPSVYSNSKEYSGLDISASLSENTPSETNLRRNTSQHRLSIQ